jgi:hypothetical protein
VVLIREKLKKRGAQKRKDVERVASILERDRKATIASWLVRVCRESELIAVPLSDEARTGHLPKLLQEVVERLHKPRVLGTKAVSEGATLHGNIRRSQGYSVPMLIEDLASCRSASSKPCRRTLRRWILAHYCWM